MLSKAKAAFYLAAGVLLVPCIGTLNTLQTKAWAQQPNALNAQIKADWDNLLRDSAELEATNPQGAITRYQKFFEEEGYRSSAVGLQISLRIARIYQFEFRNYDKAIEIYDWALSLYKNQPDAITLQKGRLTAIEAQNKAENIGGSKGVDTVMGNSPLAVPIPKPAGGGSLGVNIGTPNKIGALGVGLAPLNNSGVGSNPFSPSKPSNSQLGINLPSTVGVTQPVSVSAPPPLGTALGWQPGPQRCVTALAQQSGGTLWVATEDSGVWRYDPAVAQLKDRWTQFTAKDGLADENAYALAVDSKGRVWVGTLNHGVSVWNGKEWKNYGVLDGPLGERVFDIAVCPTDGDVWLATNAGLTRYSMKGNSWSYVTCADGLPSDQIQAIAFDKSGNIVLGTQCDGVALANAADGYKTWRVVKGPETMPLTATGAGLPSSLINDVLVAREGIIYAATTTGLAWSNDGGAKWAYVRGQDYADKVRGLYRGAPVGWREGVGAVLAEDYVSCLAQDEAGLLWVGYWKKGSEMIQMQSSPAGLGIKEVSYRKESGFVKAMLPRDGGALLLARYDEGLSYGSAAKERNDEAITAVVKPKTGVVDLTVTIPVAVATKAKTNN
jgi:sugar lactone lactonase YvrE